jgi:phosphoserine aminotransferase
MKPQALPQNPRFSSGPCTKRPGWSPDVLSHALLGRSHRSKPGKARLAAAIDKTRTILGVPEGYRIGIVPASDTGAVEMVLWSMLGARGVDVLAWESFGTGWAVDIRDHLKLEKVRLLDAPFGEIPDLTQVNFNNDVVFAWNGTTSGVRVPDGNWIADDRKGLTICDATSAAFAMALPWGKLDCVTFSWQKVLGGEAQHGVIILGPRAVKRLESYTPAWPLPKIFRMTKGGKLIQGIFEGSTINTPSMLCVEDYVDALNWAEDIGGRSALVARTNKNAAAIADWVSQTPWIDFLVGDNNIRSTTSVCLKITDPEVTAMDDDAQGAFAKSLCALLDAEGAAFDIGAYRDAPPGLRIWAGATVETSDLRSLFPWLDWAFKTIKNNHTAEG